MKESLKVLEECKNLQIKKSEDYQNKHSTVKQSDYYPRGCLSLFDIMHGKLLRIKSVLESNNKPNFESLEDSAKDLINYSSFFVSYLRGKMEGQSLDKDFLNKKNNKGF
jgi:hypothetical protein